jgi:hypothetical protein
MGNGNDWDDMDGWACVGWTGMGICIWGLDTVSGLHRLVGCACYTKAVVVVLHIPGDGRVDCVGILKIPSMQLKQYRPYHSSPER